MEHWWEISFNCGLLKSEQLLSLSNAEVETRKKEALSVSAVHKDRLDVFDSPALSAAASAAAV